MSIGWLENGKLSEKFPWKSVPQGSAGYIVAAFDPALKGTVHSIGPETKQDELTELDHNGSYLEDSQIATAKEHATDPVIAGKLWELSEKLVRQKF
jgi:hypothetical protein